MQYMLPWCAFGGTRAPPQRPKRVGPSGEHFQASRLFPGPLNPSLVLLSLCLLSFSYTQKPSAAPKRMLAAGWGEGTRGDTGGPCAALNPLQIACRVILDFGLGQN